MRLSDMDFRGVHDAVIQSGIAEPEATWIVTDFLGDSYWDDPKCAARRIRLAGGDTDRFFRYLIGYYRNIIYPEVNWNE